MRLTPEMLAEKAALEKELNPPEADTPMESKLSPDLQAEKAKLEKELGTGSTKPGTAMSYIKAGARGIDYARAASTAPLLAMGLQKITGKPVYNEDEDKAALAGNAPYPSSSELFKRAGMKDGYALSDAIKSPLSMAPGIGPALGEIPALQYQPKGKGKWWQPEKGGFFDPSVRGALGTLTDAVIDPATYATLGGSQAAKLGVAAEKTSAMDALRALLKAPSNAMAKTGKALYESGVKPLIQAGEEAGKPNIGESLYQGIDKSSKLGDLNVMTPTGPIAGSAKSIRSQMLGNAKELYNQRKDLFKKAGAENIDPFAAFEPYVNHVIQLVEDSRVTAEEGNKLISKGIDKYTSRWIAPNGAPFGTVVPVKRTGPELATTWKTDMNNAMPERTRQIVEDSDMGEKLGKIGAGGLQHEAEATVGRAVPGGDKQLANINSKLGELLTLRKSARAMSKAEANRAYVTAADAAIGGSGIIGGQLLPALGIGGEVAAHAPMYAVGALIGKKTHDFAKTTAFRTKAGALLRQIGEDPMLSPAIDTLSRRLAVEELLSKKKGAQ